MPYTPPSQRSPVASQSSTPPRKVSTTSQTTTQVQPNGIKNSTKGPANPARSNNSQSYLHKHRRSPSLSKHAAALAEQAAAERAAGVKPIELDAAKAIPRAKPKSPQASGPKTSLPSGREDSPPSTHSSDGEGYNARNLYSRNRMEELHAAIRGIEQNRSGSPAPPEERKENELARDFSKPYLEASVELNTEDFPCPTPPLSDGARKISHSRSSTDTTAYFDMSKDKYDSPPRSGSDEDLDDEDLEMKPSLIRKKSGELVRPALRGRRRPSSMPGTPTYSKAVHFQDHSLEEVKTFLQVDRPIAVSTGTSPVDPHDSEDEFPFGDADGTRSPPYEWEIRLGNFPRESFLRQSLPIRVESIYLSPDTRTLYGSVAVKNLSFHKVVIARFTLDYWRTTSEVVAAFSNDTSRKRANDGCDRFVFEINLEEHTKLEQKTMYFCVRYQVAGQEFWDNNDSMNYQVDFSKKAKARNGGLQPAATRPLESLPRGNPPRQRPRSMPSFDDFGSHAGPFDFGSFPQPNAMVGDSPFRPKKATGKDAFPDMPSTKPKNPGNQQAFANRYDFGASLSAAIQASVVKSPSPNRESPPTPILSSASLAESKPSAPPLTNAPKPAALTSEKPSLQSPSYHELLDKYCFFGSGKVSTAPREPAGLKAQPTMTDGTDGSMHPAVEAPSSTEPASQSPSPPASPSLPTAKKPSFISSKIASQRTSRSASPATSAITSRSHSPGFGYPYHQGMQGSWLEAQAPTAIQG